MAACWFCLPVLQVRFLTPEPIFKGVILTTETSSSVLNPETFKPLTDALSVAISPSGIVSVLVAAAGISLVFVGVWWGIGWAKNSFFKAFRTGRLK